MKASVVACSGVRIGSRRCRRTSLREQPASATLRCALPLAGALGISRVTDITRLDRLGLPVWTSIRPRATTLRVHAGKGLRPLDARVGALMEAIEFAVAERASARSACERVAIGDWIATLPDGLRLVDFAPRVGPRVTDEREIALEACDDLCSGRPLHIPAELVHVPYVDPGHDGVLFGWTTNGLASGNSLAEATLHALFEVLERDALVLGRARDRSALLRECSLPQPLLDWVLRWRRAGIETFVRSVPNLFSLPCFAAYLHEPASTDVNLACGSGLHASAEVALARAVCEAAQSRSSTIHGGRDSLTGFYDKYTALPTHRRLGTEARLLELVSSRERMVDFDELACSDLPHDQVDPLLAALLDRLRGLGMGCVLRHRHTAETTGVDLGPLHVVKVIVPRCESPQHAALRMGPRLLAQVLGNA